MKLIEILAAIAVLACAAQAAEPIAAVSRRVPPPGIEIPKQDRARLEQRLAELEKRFATVEGHDAAADIAIYLKAVEYALLHGEFYNAKELPRADDALDRAAARLDAMATGETPWQAERGLIVRGYASRIDGSPQPYGLVVPEKLDHNKPVPLYVWLHGRGDKTTDLHFIHGRQNSVGKISPYNAIVLHPFGRQCIGFKSAGEIDVLEAIEHVTSQYKIDADRIVLIGFSMGGAGAWHLGAHYADKWVAMSPGAGFAETARYNRLLPEAFPPQYEQRLWGMYDVPCYVRNLFNLPVVAYSGELDKQIQAARVMEEAFEDEGRKLPHIIGPGMGHQYHPDSLAELMRRMAAAVDRGLDRSPDEVYLQTRTLRYNKMHWVEAMALDEHWRDSRIDARRNGGEISLTTSNIAALRLPGKFDSESISRITIDKQSIDVQARSEFVLVKSDGRWTQQADGKPSDEGPPSKSHGLQGPIDDAFLAPFLLVTPSKPCASQAMQDWVDFEIAHFRSRWRALFRGELREKSDLDVSPADVERYHLVLFGDSASNRLIENGLKAHEPFRLPLAWTNTSLKIGNSEFDATSHVPLMIFPNPSNPRRYIVLNSGPTFREGHDRTNSLQNPKLPDWAVIDIRTPPNDTSAGRVVAADFFDERWRVKAER